MEELRIILFYGGNAATEPREQLLNWLRTPPVETILRRSIQARKVGDLTAHSEGSIDIRVSDAIAWADVAIALITPDTRGAHGASNVIEEIGRWREKKGASSLAIIRHHTVPVHSNLAGVVYIKYHNHPTIIDECRERLLTFLQDASRNQSADLVGASPHPLPLSTSKPLHDNDGAGAITTAGNISGNNGLVAVGNDIVQKSSGQPISDSKYYTAHDPTSGHAQHQARHLLNDRRLMQAVQTALDRYGLEDVLFNLGGHTALVLDSISPGPDTATQARKLVDLCRSHKQRAALVSSLYDFEDGLLGTTDEEAWRSWAQALDNQ